MAIRKACSTLAFLILLVGFSNHTFAQANCALRNPSRQIYAIFPEATSFRTVEAEVNQENRLTLESRIGSPLAPTDLGVHSAYVVLNGKVPIGFVHARSEIGTRGSIELVWAMDVDLTITEFRVQRSRERNTKTIESDAFRAQIVGCNLNDLRAFLSNGNDEIDLASLGLPVESATIAHTAVLCALKTRVITEYCFEDSITSAQILSYAHREFSGVTSIARTQELYTNTALDLFKQTLGRVPNQADLTTLDVVRILGENGDQIGILIRANWKFHRQNPQCWWAINNDGSLRRATIAGRSFESEQQELNKFQGLTFEDINTEDSGTEPSTGRLAQEILAVAAAIGSAPQSPSASESDAEVPSGE